MKWKSQILWMGFMAFFLGCEVTKPEFPSPKDSEWFGNAMPQWLTGDTTILFVSDYFYKDARFDSISIPEGLEVGFLADSSALQIVRNSREQHLFGLNFHKNGFTYQLVLKNRPKFEHVFSYTGNAQTRSVYVKGDFNGWSSSANELINDGNNIFKTKVNLAPGEYGYQIIVNDLPILDPANPKTRSNGMGGTNSLLSAILPEPNLSLITENFDKDFITLSVEGRADKLLILWENHPVKEIIREEKRVKFRIPEEAKSIKRSTFRIFAANKNGHSNDVLIPLERGVPLTDGKLADRNDLEHTVMYFVMLDRFFDGDTANNRPLKDDNVLPKANYMGGDLSGVLKKLKEGYFNELGVNALWISPIAQNPEDAWGQFRDPDTRFSGYHGYWPVSSSQVDDRFGNREVLNELLDEAHRKGINVYLDYVANHVHKSHPVFQKHPEWATSLYLPDGTLNTERWDDHRLTTWFDTFMPTLDLEDPFVAEYMSDSALFWMKQYDFDGFRHDATKHIPESFWRIVTRKMKQEVSTKGKQRFYQIGETYGNPDLISGYLGTGLLDAQFDFNLYDVMLPAFAYGETTFQSLLTEQMRSLNYYGYHHLMGNITGNQDKPRFISYADGQLPRNIAGNEYKRMGWKDQVKGVKHDTAFKRMALMQTYLLTVPGLPVIYYGDEIGMPGAGDPDNRRMMKFQSLTEQEAKLKSHVKQLAELRVKFPSLMYGDFNIEKSADQWMVFSRKYFNEMALVCINKSNQPQTVKLKLPAGFNRVRTSKTENGANITFQKSEVEVTIPALTSSVYIVVKK